MLFTALVYQKISIVNLSPIKRNKVILQPVLQGRKFISLDLIKIPQKC